MSTTGTICNRYGDASRVVKDCSHDRPSRCAAKELARPRKAARAIVVGILAAVAALVLLCGARAEDAKPGKD